MNTNKLKDLETEYPFDISLHGEEEEEEYNEGDDGEEVEEEEEVEEVEEEEEVEDGEEEEDENAVYPKEFVVEGQKKQYTHQQLQSFLGKKVRADRAESEKREIQGNFEKLQQNLQELSNWKSQKEIEDRQVADQLQQDPMAFLQKSGANTEQIRSAIQEQVLQELVEEQQLSELPEAEREAYATQTQLQQSRDESSKYQEEIKQYKQAKETMDEESVLDKAIQEGASEVGIDLNIKANFKYVRIAVKRIKDDYQNNRQLKKMHVYLQEAKDIVSHRGKQSLRGMDAQGLIKVLGSDTIKQLSAIIEENTNLMNQPIPQPTRKRVVKKKSTKKKDTDFGTLLS